MICKRCGAYIPDGYANISRCPQCGAPLSGKGGTKSEINTLIIAVTVIAALAIAATATVLIFVNCQKDSRETENTAVQVTSAPTQAASAPTAQVSLTQQPAAAESSDTKVIIVPQENNAADVVDTKVMYVTNCNEYISLRNSPSTSASSLAQIPLGSSVEVLSSAGNGFYKVRYNGQTGYALSQYLSNSPGKKSTGTAVSTMWVVNCDEWVTLRNSPSTSAASLAQIPLGASVGYISSAENGFYKVSYGGQTGYVLAQYLASSAPAAKAPSTSTLTVVNCDEWITLRSSPSVNASSLAQIPLGKSVEFISTAENGFYKVRYNGKTGYALSQYLD